MDEKLRTTIVSLLTAAIVAAAQHFFAVAPQQETREANRDLMFECFDSYRTHMEEEH